MATYNTVAPGSSTASKTATALTSGSGTGVVVGQLWPRQGHGA